MRLQRLNPYRHGRDGNLCVWNLEQKDEASFSQQLPVEDEASHRKQPWLLHTLDVSSLTFCSFASCAARSDIGQPRESPDEEEQEWKSSLQVKDSDDYGIVLAYCGAIDSTVEVRHLPSEKQLALIPAANEADRKTGMLMALRIVYSAEEKLRVIAGYESGRTYVFQQNDSANTWDAIYTARPHDQPVLSLDVSPMLDYFLTSSADAIIAKHSTGEAKEVRTKHAGQQGLRVRSDGKIFATGGWDGRGRVYSCKTMKELAVLKWHKQGCYAVSFAEIKPSEGSKGTDAEQHGDNNARALVAASQKLTFAQARNIKARTTHWLALGSKDGKVSLWDIY